MRKIWCRVGVELELPEEICTRIANGEYELFRDAVCGKIGNRFLYGDTYIPDIEGNEGLENVECCLEREYF